MTAFYDIDGNEVLLGGSNNAGHVNPIFLQTTLVAHKMNTAANYTTAFGNGYKIIEVDVRFTSDSVPVLSHDASVSGYNISSYTYSELLELVPSIANLHDFLIYCKIKNICAEIDFTKEYNSSQCRILYDELLNTGMISNSMITTYKTPLTTLSSYNPSLILCASSIETTGAVDEVSTLVNSSALAICSVPYASATVELINYMHSKGFKVKPWTVDNVSTARMLFELGADYIITNTILPSAL